MQVSTKLEPSMVLGYVNLHIYIYVSFGLCILYCICTQNLSTFLLFFKLFFF